MDRQDLSDYYVMVDGKEVMTTGAVMEQIRATMSLYYRTELRANIATVIAVLSMALSIWLLVR